MALFLKIIYNITGDFMGVKVNNTNKTFNDYNFGDFFNVGNLYNYEKLIITKDEVSGLSAFHKTSIISDSLLVSFGNFFFK